MVEGLHTEERLMTHKPAIPAANTPPYPAHPAPRVEPVDVAAHDDGTSPSSDKGPTHRGGMIGAAVGIGSAAIVAALLYASKKGW